MHARGRTRTRAHKRTFTHTRGRTRTHTRTHTRARAHTRAHAQGFLGGSVKNLPGMQETWIKSLGQKETLEREWLSTPVFSPGEFHGQGSLEGYSSSGCKDSDKTGD